MLKDTDYQVKIAMLQPWLVEIIETVKKDLKKEHFKIDPAFCKRYFFGKNPSLVSSEEMAEAYRTDIEKGNVGLGEFIASRWLLKNTDLYGFFETRLKSIHPDFDALELLPEDEARGLMQGAADQFGATRTYLFAVFNSVVFPETVFTQLKAMAEKETAEIRHKVQVEGDAATLDEVKKRYDRQIAALIDRFEKKLIGMEKKYLNDTAILKKQIGQLQKKLTELSHNGS